MSGARGRRAFTEPTEFTDDIEDTLKGGFSLHYVEDVKEIASILPVSSLDSARLAIYFTKVYKSVYLSIQISIYISIYQFVTSGMVLELETPLR